MPGSRSLKICIQQVDSNRRTKWASMSSAISALRNEGIVRVDGSSILANSLSFSMSCEMVSFDVC